jgi:hypothetical protein
MVTDANDSVQSEKATVAAGEGGEQQPQPGQQVGQQAGQQKLAEMEHQHGMRAATVRLPFVTARFEIPRAPSGSVHVGPLALPSPGKAAYYAGLGVLAVAEIIEWPVAVAIGAGTYVAQHTRAEEPTLPQLMRPPAKPAQADAGQGEPAEAEQREPVAAPA